MTGPRNRETPDARSNEEWAIDRIAELEQQVKELQEELAEEKALRERLMQAVERDVAVSTEEQKP